MILELHLIQNFAPSNLNRSDTGSPKDCTFGGFRRARISSQSFKRAMREHFAKSSLLNDEQTAYRSKRLHEKLFALVSEKDSDFENLEFAIEAILSMNGIYLVEKKVEQDEEENQENVVWVSKSETLAFLGKDTVNELAEIIADNKESAVEAGKIFQKYREDKRTGSGYKGEISKDDKSKLRGKVKKILGKDLAAKIEKIMNGSKASDLALFGRMLADMPDMNSYASSQVAHAISTHKVGVEFDFYTAVDDLKPDDTSGADMLGIIEFNSACFYRYLNVDIDLLRGNLQEDEDDLVKATVEAFIRSAIEAIPTGKQNSFATHEKPNFVLAIVRDAGFCSLANSFETPAKEKEWNNENKEMSEGLVKNSIEKLANHWEKVTGVYDDNSKAKNLVTTSDADLKGLKNSDAGNVETLINNTMNAIFA